jgi:predicted dehydrogenase
VRTALIGCGAIAPVHLHAAQQQPSGIAYVGAFDSDSARLAAITEQFALPRTYTSWPGVLADPEVDAVDLCVPHHLHHPLALEALAAGKHVLVEKPLAPTTPLCAEMVERASHAGRVLMPVHNRLFEPTLVRLKEILDSGALGDPYMIKTSGIEAPDTVGVRPWLNQHQFGGGGVTLAQTVHFAYLCRFFMGEVRSVGCLHGRRFLPEMEDEDTAIILVKFASGSIGEMTSTFVQESGGLEHRVTVYGRRGVATATHMHLQVTSEALYGDQQPHDELVLEHRSTDVAFGAVLQDFAQAIETGVAPAVSALDGLRAVEIIEASTRAARDHCLVDLPLANP